MATFVGLRHSVTTLVTAFNNPDNYFNDLILKIFDTAAILNLPMEIRTKQSSFQMVNSRWLPKSPDFKRPKLHLRHLWSVFGWYSYPYRWSSFHQGSMHNRRSDAWSKRSPTCSPGWRKMSSGKNLQLTVHLNMNTLPRSNAPCWKN